jgi:hypothetical protein
LIAEILVIKSVPEVVPAVHVLVVLLPVNEISVDAEAGREVATRTTAIPKAVLMSVFFIFKIFQASVTQVFLATTNASFSTSISTSILQDDISTLESKT